MDKAYILALPVEDLYRVFVESVLTDAMKYETVIEELEDSERYSGDFIFRIHVQTAKQFVGAVKQDYEEVAALSFDLIDRALALELYEILNLNYHIAGICYKHLGLPEKSLECFMNVLKFEKIHGLQHLTSMAYFYIGELYLLHDNEEYALEYIDLALKTLEETKDCEPRYHNKKLMFTSIVIQLLYGMKKYDELYQYVKIIEDNYFENQDTQNLYTYNTAMMFYHFGMKEYDKAKEKLYAILAMVEGVEPEFTLQQVKVFLTLAFQRGLNLEYYEKELLLCENLPDSILDFVNYVINRCFCAYYEEIGNRDAAMERLFKAVGSLEKEVVDLKQNRVNSLKSIERSFAIQEKASFVQSKNTELKMMAEEALKNKNLAERTLNRLEVVNELGKKLTLSLDLSGVIDTVYQSLQKNVPMEVFIIMVKDEKENLMKSLIYYDRGVAKETLSFDADAENSMFVETFKSNRHILIRDFYLDTRFHKAGEDMKSILSRSVLSLPLSIENEVIGVCSLQHTQPNMYSDEHISFLEELMPYLAIAMNNAFKSAALEREIAQHKMTQSKLRQANRRLAAMSNQDGLTQISNRRNFERRVAKYLKRAEQNNQSVSMFMFDIDHFKFFNDTYGHLEGDEVLKLVAAFVRDNIEDSKGISARFGGEEFIAACVDLSQKEAMDLAERIRGKVYALGIKNEKAPLGIVSISVGIAYADGSYRPKKSNLMRWADISLYQAKRTGKNKSVLKVVGPDEGAPETMASEESNPKRGI